MTPQYSASSPLPFSTGSDEEILAILKEYQIGLTVEEAKKIVELLGRDPSLTEAIIWGIQGSEHCSYKSSRRFLKQFVTEGKHIILGPVEDSGIVAITDEPHGKRWGLVITHESHNHPSQIVPYEGAATGVGGTVRDVLCMGARVIGCMDMLRLGDLKTEESTTIAKEVIRGIGGYGNPLGVPNLGGDTVFNESYNANCLVNAIALGIVREDEIIHSYTQKEAAEVGYEIILVGKPTDRSGFGGAAFASASMEEDKKEQNSGAVQEPNPFLERHLLASFYSLFDWLAANKKLDKVSCKDLGAGGVVCASVEQIDSLGFGADVNLDAVHTALDDLPAEVIGCAETQERLCITCHPDLTEHILKHFNEDWDLPSVAENAGASLVGKINNSGIYRLTHKGEVVCEAPSQALTSGLQYKRPLEPRPVHSDEPLSTIDYPLSTLLQQMLEDPNHASKDPAILHFDKNVIGNTIVEAGEADAGVIAPLQDLESYVLEGQHPGWEVTEEQKWTGVALSADGNGTYGKMDPYWQGVNAAVESMRNVVAVGATPRALTDCLNYGNPEIPEQLWELSEGVRGIADAGKTIKFEGEPVPVISGNVSLYNGRPDGTAIDPTAIVSCTGVMQDARKAVTMQLKRKNSAIVLVGERKNEALPKPDFAEVTAMLSTMLHAHNEYEIRACHDISEGGMLLALFEMMLPQRKTGGDIGVKINLEAIGSDLETDILLRSQSGGFLIEIDTERAGHLAEDFRNAGILAHVIGETLADPLYRITRDGEDVLSESMQNLLPIWQMGLQKAL